ncbi:MAG: amidohydrolase [Pelagimonas sp.]
MAVVNRIAGFAEEMAGWRRHLHMNPELGLDCHETAGFVVERLKEFGVDEIHPGIATSGVVAVIHGKGEGPVTALRADMDALPMDEETGKDWASTVPGKMHACGHDGHTSMLLGAAKYLAETRNFKGKVVLLFQPAEETIGGGRIMVQDEKVMDRFGVEEVYGIHTDPFAEFGELRTGPGALMAAVDDFNIIIKGKGGHAAFPHETIDPLPCVFALGSALQSVVSRNVNPMQSAVLSLTQVHGGSAMNIIPEEAVISGTLRTLSPEMREMGERRIREMIAGHAASFGVEIELDWQAGYPPTINHAAQAMFAADVARGVTPDVVDNLAPEMGAEDFSYMLEARPGAFLFLGQGIGPSVHHPEFDFNDEVAPVGASFFARLIETRHAI